MRGFCDRLSTCTKTQCLFSKNLNEISIFQSSKSRKLSFDHNQIIDLLNIRFFSQLTLQNNYLQLISCTTQAHFCRSSFALMIIPQGYFISYLDARSRSLLSGAEQWNITSFLILIFNLSVFELVGFQTKLFKDLWYMYFHAVKVFSMFFLSSLDFRWAYCGQQFRSILQKSHL